jgi:hypothetical protein
MKRIAQFLLVTVIAFTASVFLTVDHANAQFAGTCNLKKNESCIIPQASSLSIRVKANSSVSASVKFEAVSGSNCTRTVQVPPQKTFTCDPLDDFVKATNLGQGGATVFYDGLI